MNKDTIHIKGARTHNLKNVEVEIPHNSLTVVTGLSGSGAEVNWAVDISDVLALGPLPRR